MDNSQPTTQLAQINTLSGIEKLNTTLGSISGQISTSQSLQSSTLIGHGVMVNGAQVLVGSSITTPFGVELTSVSTATAATIKDASGTVIDTVDLGALSAGVYTFSWDGKLERRFNRARRQIQRCDCGKQWQHPTGGTTV